MRRLAIATALASLATIRLVGGTPAAVSTYVAVDADGDRQPSVGDTVGWFVAEPGAVTLRCWADDTKARLVSSWVSPAYAPATAVEATGRSRVLDAAGYCESAGAGGGLHWFKVAP